MRLLALSDRSFQHLTDWVGGIMVLLVVALLTVLDMKVLKSGRSTLTVAVGTGVLSAVALGIVVWRFIRLSV